MSERAEANETRITRALLLDTGKGEALAPFLEKCAAGMLSIGTKPVVQIWMEVLADAGVNEVMLLLTHVPEQVRSFLGSGERWGIKVSFAIVREDIPLGQKIAHAREFIKAGTFIAELNVVPLEGFIAWLTQAALCGSETLACFPEMEKQLEALIKDGFLSEAGQYTLSLPELDTFGKNIYRIIDGPDELWQINMDMFSAEVVDTHRAGFENEKGVFICRNSRFHQTVKLNSPCIVGENSIFSERIQIGPNAILGNNMFADVGSSIRNSVVFDHTFIGSYMELDRVIASGRVLYSMDSKMYIHLDDPLLVADIESGGGSLSSLLQRLVAALILVILFVPVMVRALILKATGKPVWLKEKLILEVGLSLDGQREFRELTVTSLAVKNPSWRKIFWLWQVVLGAIALTGIMPRMTRADRLPDWTSDVVWVAPGVVTLADVTGVSRAGSDSEDVLIADAYYQSTTKSGLDLQLLWRWIALLFKCDEREDV